MFLNQRAIEFEFFFILLINDKNRTVQRHRIEELLYSRSNLDVVLVIVVEMNNSRYILQVADFDQILFLLFIDGLCYSFFVLLQRR